MNQPDWQVLRLWGKYSSSSEVFKIHRARKEKKITCIYFFIFAVNCVILSFFFFCLASVRIQSWLPRVCVGAGLGSAGWSQALRMSQGSLHLSLPRATISSRQNLLLQFALSPPQPVSSALFPWVKLPWHGAEKGSEPRTLLEALGEDHHVGGSSSGAASGASVLSSFSAHRK